MSASFDPYHRWLGIPPEKQPPNHYGLLAIEPLEDNPDVIESAADQRMAHLRTFQTGKHGELSQKLLNEVAAAKVCLLNPQKKAAYDEALRQKLAAEKAAKEKVAAAPQVDPGLAGLFEKTQQAAQGTAAKAAGKMPPAKLAVIAGAIAVAGLLVAVGLLIWGPGSEEEPSGQNAATAQGGREIQRPNQPEPEHPPGPPAPDQGTATSVAGPEKPNPGEQANPTTATTPPEPAPDKPAAEEDPTGIEPPAEPQPVEEQKRMPVPSDEAQGKTAEQIDEVYNLAGAKTSAQKLQLAGKLFDLGKQAQDNPAERFVLLRKAMELATDGGDAALMLKVVDTIGADFEVDVLDVKQKVVIKFAKAANDAKRVGSLVESSLPLIDRALAEGRCDVAYQLVEATYRACTGARGDEHRKRVYDRRGEVRKQYQEWQQFQDALSALKDAPDDAEANLTVGRWYCLKRGDWGQGLPYLAKCSDEGLKAAAGQEISSAPTDPAQQIAAGDAWWAAAEMAKDEAKTALLHRAGHWYEQARPNVKSVVTEGKLDQRLGEIPKTGQPVPEASGGRIRLGQELPRGRWTDILQWVDFGRDTVTGEWKREEDAVTVAPKKWSSIMLPVVVDGSYDLEVDFTRDGGSDTVVIILPVGAQSCTSAFSILSGKFHALEAIDGRSVYQNNPTTKKPGTLLNGRRYRILIRVRLQGENAAVDISVDGVPFIYWTGKQASFGPGWKLPDPTRPGLGAYNVAATFHKARLRLISGKAAWVHPAGAQPGGGAASGDVTPHLPDPIKPPSPQPGDPDGRFDVKSSVPFIRRAKRGLPVRIFASGCNSHAIHLNGMPLMQCDRTKPSAAAAILKEGDVLTVKLGDRFDVMSLWMAFQTGQGEYLFETSDRWTAYLPQDDQRWWDIQNIRPGARKAEYVRDSQEYVDLVKKAARQAVPSLPKGQPITSPLSGENGRGDSYLYYVVTVEDLLPKKLRPQQQPALPSRPPPA